MRSEDLGEDHLQKEELKSGIRKSITGLVIGFFVLTCGSIVVQAKQHKIPSRETRSAAGVDAQQPAGPAPSAGVPAAADYKIGPGDVLVIDVWKEPEITQTETVRPDGRISLPLIGDFVASGQTPRQLAAEVTQKLGQFVDSPQVTVILKETKSRRVNVLGMVAKPGSYDLVSRMTVLDAIAAAGGLKEFAKSKKIYVLRVGANGAPARIPFNYKKVLKGQDPTQDIELKTGDTVVVP